MSPSPSDDSPDLPAAEHARWMHYQHAFTMVPDAGELALVATVLEDPDQVMAQSAVVWHIDRRAAALLDEPQYSAWAQAMTDAVEGYPFIVQRIREWSLLRAITLAEPWNPDALLNSSDWLQRKVSQSRTSPQALTILAEAGRTRRVRNVAKQNLNTKNK
ncbi:hypothetical protein OG203_11145 [Nocardia sp. NBC_01499]|uniref:hypothetical protein n=1 Tax=Nocardia sp. NBC_01499 TaxID=2903597 RepID=UPI00386AACFE